jgi:hypothetical protein
MACYRDSFYLSNRKLKCRLLDETKANERNVSKGDNGVVMRRVGGGKGKQAKEIKMAEQK